jgi:hypothetical protein
MLKIVINARELLDFHLKPGLLIHFSPADSFFSDFPPGKSQFSFP